MSRIRSPDFAASSGSRSAPNFQTKACLASYKFAFQSDRPSWDGSLIAGLAASLFFYGASIIRKAIWRAMRGFRRLAECSERVLCHGERRANSRLGAQDVAPQGSLGET